MADTAALVDGAETAGAGALAGGRKKSPWMAHVKKTMRANKGMKLGKVLKLAAKSYKKTKRGGAALSPAAVGGRRRKSRGTRRH